MESFEKEFEVAAVTAKMLEYQVNYEDNYQSECLVFSGFDEEHIVAKARNDDIFVLWSSGRYIKASKDTKIIESELLALL